MMGHETQTARLKDGAKNTSDDPQVVAIPLRRAWSLRVAGDNRADLVYATDNPEQARITIHRLATNAPYDIQLNQTRYAVAADSKYRLTFRGRADDVRDVCLGFSKASPPWSNLGLYRRLQLTTDWADYAEDFVATSDDDNGRIHFDLADAAISVELSSVGLWRVTDSGLVAVGRSERHSPMASDSRNTWVGTDSSTSAGPSWVVSAPNRPGARVLPTFRMFAVLGTWNEADIVAATVRNAIAQGCEGVYLVDNGSTDGTVEAARLEGSDPCAFLLHESRYDEALRLRHMNDVVSEVSQSEGDRHIWWLFLDADEFPHGPWGMTLREYLATLDEQFRVVGTRFFNHYPSGAPQYEPGRHPLDFQPLCEELAFPMCPDRHRKHPLTKDMIGAALLSGAVWASMTRHATSSSTNPRSPPSFTTSRSATKALPAGNWKRYGRRTTALPGHWNPAILIS